MCNDVAPINGTGHNSLGSGLRANASFHTWFEMWGGFGADRCPPPRPPTPPPPPIIIDVVVVELLVVRCSGANGSYKIAVNAHNELGILLLAKTTLRGSDATDEYLECKL